MFLHVGATSTAINREVECDNGVAANSVDKDTIIPITLSVLVSPVIHFIAYSCINIGRGRIVDSQIQRHYRVAALSIKILCSVITCVSISLSIP